MTDLLVARWLHFYGFALWIGTLFAAMGFLAFRDKETDAGFKERIAGQAKFVLRFTDLGATLAIAGGIYMAVKLSAFSQPWLHLKLTLVVGIIALHGYVRAKAGKASKGQGNFPVALLPALTVVALGILFVAVFKPFMK